MGGDTKSKENKKTVGIRWTIPSEMRAVFANQLLVSHQDDQFILNFAESFPPPAFTPEDLDEITEVPAQVFSRIAVPAAAMQSFIDVLNKNYTRYQKENEK